jgi:hypothetical protein
MANTAEKTHSVKTNKATEREKLEKLFGVDPGTCLSGSGITPRKGLFAPGGDAKLKSRLLKEFRTGGKRDAERALKQATALGWERFLTPSKTSK